MLLYICSVCLVMTIFFNLLEKSTMTFFLFLLSNYITNSLKELCSTFIIVKNFECTGAIVWYGIWLILKNMSRVWKMPRNHDFVIAPLLKMLQVCIDTIPFYAILLTLFRAFRFNSSPLWPASFHPYVRLRIHNDHKRQRGAGDPESSSPCLGTWLN